MRLQVVKTLDGVAVDSVTPEGGLPNEAYPSDHIAIAADLLLKHSA